MSIKGLAFWNNIFIEECDIDEFVNDHTSDKKESQIAKGCQRLHSVKSECDKEKTSSSATL